MAPCSCTYMWAIGVPGYPPERLLDVPWLQEMLPETIALENAWARESITYLRRRL